MASKNNNHFPKSFVLLEVFILVNLCSYVRSEDFNTFDSNNEVYGEHEDEVYGDHDHYEDMYGHDYYGYDHYGDHYGYQTHGSLLIQNVEDLNEFLDMDTLEAAVIGFFPNINENDEIDHEFNQDSEYYEYSQMAKQYSHLARFAHTYSKDIIINHLNLNSLKSTVLIYPAKKLLKVHQNAGKYIEFPGKKLTIESLTKFIFYESAPLIDQYDWRALERATLLEIPTFTLFSTMFELHHSYHLEEYDQKEQARIMKLQESHQHHQHDDNDIRIHKEEEEEQREETEFKKEDHQEALPWTFHQLSTVLLPCALENQHDIHFLIANKHNHQFEMGHYNLQIPENQPHVFGFGIKLDEMYYSKVVVLPTNHKNEVDLKHLRQHVQEYIDLFFEGKLTELAI